MWHPRLTTRPSDGPGTDVRKEPRCGHLCAPRQGPRQGVRVQLPRRTRRRAGVSGPDAEALKKAFNIKTIGDLASNKYIRAATAIAEIATIAK
jgi:hypothetical protein